MTAGDAGEELLGRVSLPRAVAAALASEEVSQAFGLMGAGTIALVHHMQTDHSVGYHATRHESAAVGAADGYYRATGRPGVCLVTWGPGLTNATTSLITALRGHSAMVLVAGDTSTADPADFPFAAGTQGLDQPTFLRMLGILSITVSPETVAEDVAEAFFRARADERPVALLLPIQHLQTQVEWAGPVDRPQHARSFATEPEFVDQAAEVLARAERPVVLAGRGATSLRAEQALIRLADRLGAVLVTSLRGAGLFEGHPSHLGIAGGFTPQSALDLLDKADVVFAVGAGLNSFTTRQGALFPEATLIHCDVDVSAIGRQRSADIAIVGDAADVTDSLLALIGPGETSLNYRQEAAAVRESGLVPRFSFTDASALGALDPRALCKRLNDVLPTERAIVTDPAGMCEFPVEYVTVHHPDQMLWMMDFGAVGSALGTGIGAAVGRPERLTVVFIGDGGLLMNLGDLDTAVRSNLPILVVCMNDRAYGSERYHMRDWNLPEDNAFFETPDLAAVAASLGCSARTVRSLEELDGLPGWLEAVEGPLFLNCLLTQELVRAPLRDHV